MFPPTELPTIGDTSSVCAEVICVGEPISAA